MCVSRVVSWLGCIVLLSGCDSAPSTGTTTSGTGGSTSSSSSSTGGATAVTPKPSTLHVNGNTLEDNGSSVRLIGWDRPGSEYMCVSGSGGQVFDGPAIASNVQLMQTWTGFNAIRLPLNETCWLGINGVNASVSGPNYVQAVTIYVNLLRSYGIYVILDLHWNAPGSYVGTSQLPMADADHSMDFWKAVANHFKDDLGVIFDLYNEPHLDAVGSLTGGTAWSCWLNGNCTVTPRGGGEQAVGSYTIAGMQDMLTAVRSTGAQNVVMVGGNNWAGDATQWAANMPTDPTGNLAASVHAYNFASCSGPDCETTLTTIAASTPVIVGEMGEDDCGSSFIGPFMTWADATGVSYLAWSWGSENCSQGPSITTDNINGQPSGTSPDGYGVYFKNHIASLPAQ